jgi:hypothetical protein
VVVLVVFFLIGTTLFFQGRLLRSTNSPSLTSSPQCIMFISGFSPLFMVLARGLIGMLLLTDLIIYKLMTPLTR